MRQVIQEYNVFLWKFVNNYDTNNSNILRKIIHSFDVARNCYAIASQMKLNESERNLCYLMGLLHDLGRFEQWKLYQTYNDKISVDHGDLSFDILNNLNCENLFKLSKKEVEILKLSIKYHTKKYLGNDEEIFKYNKILKNADAFSNVLTSANGAQQMTTDKNGVTKEILDGFINMEYISNIPCDTRLDRALQLTACCYYVEIPFLREEIVKCNYFDNIFETFSKYLNDKEKIIYLNAINQVKNKYLI